MLTFSVLFGLLDKPSRLTKFFEKVVGELYGNRSLFCIVGGLGDFIAWVLKRCLLFVESPDFINMLQPYSNNEKDMHQINFYIRTLIGQ